MENQVIIIDGNSLVNRAYYAMQRPMITKEGMYTQGIYGFLNMLEKIKKDYKPQYIIVTFDVKAPTFRHEQYEQYKAGRKKMPLELAMQIPLLKEILDAMNIRRVELEGFEADDLIGTISKKAEDEGKKTLIITGDKDALQLASKKTQVLITKKGISQFALYDENAFLNEYGFPVTSFIDYKAIVGDKSDNIPGVAGIGDKGATKLICDYKTLENIYKNIEEVEPKGIKNKLIENETAAYMSKRLATINKNVPIDIDFEDCKLTEPDYKKLVELYKKLEFNNFLKKLDIPNVAESGAGLPIYKTVEIGKDISLAELIKCLSIINDEDDAACAGFEDAVGLRIYSDNNHKKKPKIDAIAVFFGDTVYFQKNTSDESVQSIYEAIKTSGKKIYGHDLKNEIYNLMYLSEKEFNLAFDTAIAKYVLEPSASDYSLKRIASEDFFVKIETDNLPKRASTEFAIINELMIKQKEDIKEQGLEGLLYDVELPLIEIMASMEYKGMSLDIDYLKKLGDELLKRENELTTNIHMLAGENFNINSPVQLGMILFEKLGLEPAKKTKRGYATGAEVLEKLKDKHPIIPLILEYRKLTKLTSTYIDGLLQVISDDGKVHASFNQTVTTTGRISSSNPNMQNIPVRDELGKKIRGAFVPSSNEYVFVGADYSQIELRVLAHMSGDEALIKAFNENQDIHKATAARVMGIPVEEVTSAQRSSAKAINFGVIYGMSSFGLSLELDITRKEAQNYIDDYFKKHEAVKKFMDAQIAFCKEKGYVNTILGRKRYIKEINAKAYVVRQLGERLAMNTPIQGSAADIIKLAMIVVYHRLLRMKSNLVLQVHDELIIEAHKDELDDVKKILRDAMEHAIQLSVRLTVDLNVGDNWRELK